MTPAELVNSIYEAFGRRDIGYVLAHVAPDVSWQGPSSIPWGGRHVGPEGVKSFFVTLAEDFEMTGVTVRERIADGGHVVMLGSFEGKGRKTGKTAVTDFCWAWKIEGDRVRSYQGHFDTAAILAALN